MLKRSGRPIGPNDLLIAHARAMDAIVVTANEREFRRVHGLRVENWLPQVLPFDSESGPAQSGS